MNFLPAVTRLAKAQGLSLTELERKCGWQRGTMWGILRRSPPMLSSVATIAKVLGCKTWELVRDAEEPAREQ